MKRLDEWSRTRHGAVPTSRHSGNVGSVKFSRGAVDGSERRYPGQSSVRPTGRSGNVGQTMSAEGEKKGEKGEKNYWIFLPKGLKIIKFACYLVHLHRYY